MPDQPAPSAADASGHRLVVLVAVGGALGAAARSLVHTDPGPGALPLGTLGVNVAGSLLLGLLAGWLVVRSTRPWVRPLLGTGVLGGFTTYSTFATETVQRAGSHPQTALAYVGLTVVLAVGLAAVGLRAGEAAARRSAGAGGGS